MATVKFFCRATDLPRAGSVEEMLLPVPAPGLNEYRRFFNHRDEDQDQGGGTISVPVADFVSVLADHKPTREEWEGVLLEEGYTSEQIFEIFAGA